MSLCSATCAEATSRPSRLSLSTELQCRCISARWTCPYTILTASFTCSPFPPFTSARPASACTACARLLLRDCCSCRYDTGFKIANERFSGKVVPVVMIAAVAELGSESLQPLRFSAATNRAFLRYRGWNSMIPCRSVSSNGTCNDAVMFVPPLLAGVRLDLFDFQQNV